MKKIITNICLYAILFPVALPTAAAEEARVPFADYIALVVDHNVLLAAERLNIPIAEAEVIASRMIGDPELSFEAGRDEFSLELGYTFELGRKRGARIAAAKVGSEMAGLEFAAFMSDFIASASQAYVEAMVQNELLQLHRSSYAYMKELSDGDSIRYLAGEITLNDARQSSLEAATLLNEVYSQEGEYVSALARLSYFTGGMPLEPVEIELGPIEGYDPHQMLRFGMEYRPEIVLAAKGMDAARAAFRLVKAERKADIELFVGYDKQWSGVLPKKDLIKGGVTIPLKFSNFNKGSLNVARLAQEQSALYARAVEDEVLTEITEAIAVYGSTAKRLAHFRSGMLDKAREILEGMIYRYRSGESDILEVLVANRTFNEVSEDYAQTMGDFASSVIELYRSCGLGSAEF